MTKRDVGQPDRVLAYPIARHEMERRPGAGKEWLAATKHDGMEVKPIFINQAKLGQTPGQLRSGDFDLAVEPGLQPAHRPLEVALEECGVGSDGLQRARNDPLWLAPPHRRVFALLRVPIRKVFVPIAHHFVHAAAVHHAAHAAHLLYEMTKEPGFRRHCPMIDVAVERLVQSEDELRHGDRALSPWISPRPA